MPDDLQIYLLLLFAVIAGWMLGRFLPRQKQSAPGRGRDLFDDYFLGLNYLLNDEPDEAIDTFIRALEVNSETIETHLALGALLRRRGKVDKAIKVHQTLLARPGMSQQFTDSTRLQLAIDYIAAGLLDRAERLLNEILEEDTPAKWDALKHLITIYQTEKEWQKAIDCSRLLLGNAAYRRDQEVRSAAAHYCCELAQGELAGDQFNAARAQIKRAFTFDRHSVRAAMMLAELEQRSGNYQAALREFKRICSNHPEFIGRIMEPLTECFMALEDRDGYERLLRQMLESHQDIHMMLALARLIRVQGGDSSAIQYLNQQLEKTPYLSGVLELLRYQLPHAEGELQTNLHRLQEMIDQLLSRRPFYRCNHCGYEAKSLYWLCPSCQKWDRMQPIMEASKLWN